MNRVAPDGFLQLCVHDGFGHDIDVDASRTIVRTCHK
jgi:hypothetical protein